MYNTLKKEYVEFLFQGNIALLLTGLLFAFGIFYFLHIISNGTKLHYKKESVSFNEIFIFYKTRKYKTIMLLFFISFTPLLLGMLFLLIREYLF